MGRRLPNPTLGCTSKNMKALILKDTYVPMFIAALFTIAKNGSNLSVHQHNG